MLNDVDARYTRTRYPYYTLRGGKSLLHLLSFEALLFDDIAIVPCLSAASRLSEDIHHHYCQDMTRSHSDLQFLPALLERWICLAILLPLVCGPSGFRGHGEEVGMWWALAFFVAAFTVIRGLSMNLWLSSEDHLCNTINTWFWDSGAIERLTIAVDFSIWSPSNCMAMLRYRLFMLSNMKALIENYGGAIRGVIRCYWC